MRQGREWAVAGSLVICLVVTAAVLPSASGALHGSPQWSGDFETGDLSQWRGLQAKDPSRVTLESDVVRQGRFAARFEVRPGDNNVAGSGSGERADLLIHNSTTEGVEGSEQYWAWSTYFPADFDAPMGGWNVFVGFHHTGKTGQSPVHFFVDDRKTIKMRVMGGNFEHPVKRYFTLARLTKGRWYDFVFHVKWSSDPRIGFVEVGVNRLRIVRRTSIPTLYVGMGVYLKQGFYRRAYAGTSVVIQDGMRRGSTLNEVAPRVRNGPRPE
jgi:hypothetical protein